MHPIWDDIVLSTFSYIIMYFMYPGVQKHHFLNTYNFTHYTQPNTMTIILYKALILTYILDKVGCKCWQVGGTELPIVMHQ
jgi:hypothetical protein